MGKLRLAADAPPPPMKRIVIIPTCHRAPKQEPVEEAMEDISGGASQDVDPWEGCRYASNINCITGEKCPLVREVVSFTKDDMKDVTTLHDDSVVITLIFRRGDNINVPLYWNTFTDFGLSR